MSFYMVHYKVEGRRHAHMGNPIFFWSTRTNMASWFDKATDDSYGWHGEYNHRLSRNHN